MLNADQGSFRKNLQSFTKVGKNEYAKSCRTFFTGYSIFSYF